MSHLRNTGLLFNVTNIVSSRHSAAERGGKSAEWGMLIRWTRWQEVTSGICHIN